MTVVSTIVSDAEAVGTEAFDAAIAGTRVAAPVLGKVGGFGASLVADVAPKLGVLGGPVGWVVSAWSWATSPLGRFVLALAVAASALLYAYVKGHEAGVASQEAQRAVEQHAEDLLVIDKLQSDAATVKAALDSTAAAKAKSDAQIARLNAKIAKAPRTKSCPPILLDTIRGLGGAQ